MIYYELWSDTWKTIHHAALECELIDDFMLW